VYGSSAGAINATYFLSGQREGVNIYCEDIANRRFVDLRRLVPRRGERATSAAHTHACIADAHRAVHVWSGQYRRAWDNFMHVWYGIPPALLQGVMPGPASVCMTTAVPLLLSSLA